MRRRPTAPPLAATLLAATLAAATLAGCTFDPLAGWEPPQIGTIAVGDAITPGDDATIADVPPPPPPLVIDHVAPERGDPTGDEPVVVHGSGFESGAEVWFGDQPGALPQTQQGERIFVRTPAHPPGVVDVRVVLPDGRETVAQDAFLFGRPVRVHDVEPTSGPALGGTPVTVRGEGFLPDTAVLLDGVRLIEQRVVDEATIIGITPGRTTPAASEGGLPAGPVDLIAANVVGSARLKDAFHYVAPVTVTAVRPFSGPASGGDTVSVRGSGFTREATVRFGDEPAAVVDWADDGTSLGVVVPPGPAGAVDVEVTVPERGGALLADGYVRLRDDVTAGSLTLGGLWPAEGDERGGDTVTLALSGLPDVAAAPTVLFGGAAATVLSHDPAAGRVVVRTPPGAPGPVDVIVQAAGRSVFAPLAFRYRTSFRVTAVTPAAGSVDGGTEVVVEGDGLGPGTTVWFGALPATSVRATTGGALRCATPPGAPGSVTVRVERSGREAALPAAFVYEWGELALFAVQPSRGAMAGGTWVELYGADFPPAPQVRFGNRLATDVVRLSPSRIGAYSPGARAPGSVDVAVTGGAATVVRDHGFTYFDPLGTGPGTWGGPIDGAVNVTVLQTRPLEPVANAFVMLGIDPDTPYRGWTNEDGQVTLSGPGLEGPRDVTATAVGYTAASIIEVDAENVVLQLVADVPPSPGGGGGEALPNGTVAGRVEGVEKYVPLPRAPCDEKLDVQAPLCHPCETDEDCVDPAGALPEPECTDFGLEGRRCTSGCAATACPEGFACAPLDGRPRCVPSLGPRRARCEISRRSPFWHAETQPTDVDPSGYYFVESRLGEVAVVCFGGYEDWETGAFVATRMGVKRHVFAESAETVAEQDIALDIPLTRTVVFRLDPTHPAPGEPWDTRLSVYLDFGPDGVLPLGDGLGAAASGDVTLLRVPEQFTGAIFDAGLTVYAGRYSPDELIDTPYSATYRERLDDEDIERPQVLAAPLAAPADGADGGAEDAGDAWAYEDIVLPRRPFAVWQAPDGVRFVAGEAGLLVRHTPGIGWTTQPSLGGDDILAMDGVARTSVWAVGRGGAIFHHDGLSWQRMTAPDDRDLRAVWAAGPERFVAVGDHRIVEYDRGAWTVHKVAVDLHGVSGHHWERVWAVGRDGALLLRTAGGWDRLAAPTTADLHGVWVSTTSAHGYAVGADGAALRLDDGAWEAVDVLAAVDGAPDGAPSGAPDGAPSGAGALPRPTFFAVHGRAPAAPAPTGPDGAPPGGDDPADPIADDGGAATGATTVIDVTIVGDDGAVLLFDGRRWRRIAGGAQEQSLRAVHIGRDGRWTAVGPRAVPLGPILPVMRFAEPREGSAWNGRRFRWSLGPGPEPGALFFDIIGQTGGTRWNVLAPGRIRGFELPDLIRTVGFSPVPPGTLRVRAQAAYWPTFDIDRVRSRGFSYADWISWTYHYLVME